MSQNKHAYLIMAHNNFYCLEKLLMLLDDERNDIFLHIDGKIKGFDFNSFRNLCSRAQVIFPSKRIKVHWGTQSQIKTEMLLFETARNHASYAYYHLISGVDLPLKNQDEIHNFFQNKNENYLYYTQAPSRWDIYRVSRYHFIPSSNKIIPTRIKGYLGTIQETLGINRLKNSQFRLYTGRNWCSLSQGAVETLLQHKSQIMNLTRFSLCADEVYKQTILLHYDSTLIANDLRFVDWSHGGSHPHTFTLEDFPRLRESDTLFARKFDENVDKQIIDLIFAYVGQKY